MRDKENRVQWIDINTINTINAADFAENLPDNLFLGSGPRAG